MDLNEKYKRLQEILRDMESVLVAFSGGVDSTLLLRVAHDTLGDKVCALTATSPTYPQSEFNEALDLASKMGVRHLVVESDELRIPGFAENPVDRCYHCKKELFARCRHEAAGLGFGSIADGTTIDDLSDYRPGRKAAEEVAVCSPLLEAGFSKDDVRQLSRLLGLSTWDKQPFACLASRFPHGVMITAERLAMIEKSEEFLRNLGFKVYRVRYHGETARIEVGLEELPRLIEPEIRQVVAGFFKKVGFTYVAVDLDGYRTGSMNARP